MKVIIIFFKLAFLIFILGCGVKGNPLPPDDLPVIGEGYKEWPVRDSVVEEEKQESSQNSQNRKTKKVTQ
jgi:predicted small lipoprotein YifL